MAYNLESLIKILHQLILHPDHPWIIDPNKEQEIGSLLKKALSLKKLFGGSSPVSGDKVESLESRIRDAAHEAEDVLESHLVDRILSGRKTGWSFRIVLPILSFFKGRSIIFSPQGLREIIEEFDSVEEEMNKIIDESNSSSPAVPSRTDPNPDNILVGLRQDSIQLKERLTGHDTKLEIIPIIGMGGIGKTTLARNVYDDPSLVFHFDIRAWITISQHKRRGENNLRTILTGLLGGLVGKLTDEMLQEKNEQLAVRLHKSLIGRRYLIVLDDMWLIDDWDDISRSLPDNKNGSKILLTTRETDVANYAATKRYHHKMRLLNKKQSWNLLRRKVFKKKPCPLELIEIGKEIANNCRGLPLAIHVIGGVLSQREEISWTKVARDVSSIVAKNDEQFSKILSFSYNHLPIHLKPCFLYMGVFPEDAEIRRSRLIRLWIAEGFLEPIPNKTLEEAADTYLNALVDRNLIYVRKKATDGSGKSYSIHDLLRDLCLRKACEEKFLHVINRHMSNLPQDTVPLRRVSAESFYCTWDTCSLEKLKTTRARSFLHTGNGPCRKILNAVSGLRLLKVLDILRIKLRSIPDEMPQLINLKYLAFASYSHLSSSISSLGNLQTIIFEYRGPLSRSCVVLCPSSSVITAILDLPRLQHVEIKNAFYPCGLFLLKKNLQNLSGIEINDGFLQLLKSVPNLKKLGCCGPVSSSDSIDLSHLLKLETFKCRSQFLMHASSFFFIFPPSLKKVTLRDYKLVPDQHLQVIGDLPNLQVLKLRHCSFVNPVWEPVEGGFRQLHLLLLEISNLKNWEANDSSFPILQRLVIRGCSKLERIPNGIGDIPTLQIIEVHNSSYSAVDSARKILEEQLELGNDGLQVRTG